MSPLRAAHFGAGPALAAALAGALAACADEAPRPFALRALAPALEQRARYAVSDPGPPSCPAGRRLDPLAWPRAPDGEPGLVRAAPGSGSERGHLAQRLAPGEGIARRAPLHRLRYLGAHLFDLLNKVETEGGETEEDRRRLICASLADAAFRGAAAVRLWGTLKRVGEPGEIERAARALALVLDENARRARPLRFVVVLVNHQAGYGAPDPSRSLDDQAPSSPFFARRFYLEEGWRAPGALAARVERYAAEPGIARSPYLLAWELVNELDLFRSVGKGAFDSPDAELLLERFAVPALARVAGAFPHPLALGDLRGRTAGTAYPAFARRLASSLPAPVRARLLWTSHVYAEAFPGGAPPRPGAAHAAHFEKLDRDLGIAGELGLPFYVGEAGQHLVPFSGGFCRGEGGHAPRALFDEALGEGARRAIDMAFFWGEGQCDLPVPFRSGEARRSVGAGGDAADLAPGDDRARHEVVAERGRPRWRPLPVETRP